MKLRKYTILLSSILIMVNISACNNTPNVNEPVTDNNYESTFDKNKYQPSVEHKTQTTQDTETVIQNNDYYSDETVMASDSIADERVNSTSSDEEYTRHLQVKSDIFDKLDVIEVNGTLDNGITNNGVVNQYIADFCNNNNLSIDSVEISDSSYDYLQDVPTYTIYFDENNIYNIWVYENKIAYNKVSYDEWYTVYGDNDTEDDRAPYLYMEEENEN